MLKKMFKTILVFSLCIGVVLPTNAAVSVSDGSAFVTKAEFAADLNNLSNRMAQLENSLDAKIDSLVSSYLTRNGIWNGAKQSLLKDYYWLALSDSASTTKKFTFTEGVRGYVGKTNNNVTISNKGSHKTPSSYAAGTYYRQDWATDIGLIDGYTKSGMVVMNVLSGNPYTWSGTLGDDNRDKYIDLNTDNRYLGQSGVNVEYISYGSGNEVLVGSKSIMVALDDPAIKTSLHYGISYSIDSYYFFVSKGDSLKCNLYWDYIGFGGGTGFVANKYWTSNTTAEWGPCLVFLDAYIY